MSLGVSATVGRAPCGSAESAKEACDETRAELAAAYDDRRFRACPRALTPGGAAPGDLVYVSVDSAIWPALVDRNRREKGRATPNEMGGKRGWSFPKDWVDVAETAFQVSRQ
jgi:hypothetical protein